MLILPALAIGQSSIEALEPTEGKIVLPENQDLSELYTIDISSLNFQSFEEAIEFFNSFNSNEVAFRPKTDLNTVNVYLQLKRHPDWTVADWNQELQNLPTLINE